MRKTYIILFVSIFTWTFILAGNANAQCCNGCVAADCTGTPTTVDNRHPLEIEDYKQFTTDELEKYREWLPTTFLTDTVVPDMQKATERLTVAGMNFLSNIGQLMDAKHQLETQRLLHELHFEAQKKYQPDEDICTFGTAVRSMAHTESAAKTAAKALNRRQMARHLGHKNMSGDKDSTSDKKNRWHHFTRNYCNSEDNNWTRTPTNTGLTSICGDMDGNNDENNTDKINLDIDFTRMIENRRILDIDPETWAALGDEPDIMALGNNLYGHNVLSRNIKEQAAKSTNMAQIYMELRSVAAKRNVAETTYNNLIGMRATGTGMESANANSTSGNGFYIGRILMDLGIPENEVGKYLGLDVNGTYKQASYLATLEILTKKVFQNPNFFANLYDTPENVKRKAAALKAFELMLDRAIHESQLRQEMAMSVLLSSRLNKHISEANRNLGGK